MLSNQIAAQLYTVRSLCQTPAETAATLKAIRAIGYTAVEVAGIPTPPAELARMAADLGLTVCSFHGDLKETLDDPAKIAAAADVLKSRLVVYSYPAGFDLTKREDVDRLIEKLAAAAAIYRRAGKTFCYHHHSLEFFRRDGKTVLESILERVGAEDLALELDTYWIQHGGGSPVEWCRRLAGRLPIIHLKDYGNIGGTPTFMEVGNGNLDWPPIIKAAEQSGCRWFTVEQDTCPGSPLDSLKISYDYLNSRLTTA